MLTYYSLSSAFGRIHASQLDMHLHSTLEKEFWIWLIIIKTVEIILSEHLKSWSLPIPSSGSSRVFRVLAVQVSVVVEVLTLLGSLLPHPACIQSFDDQGRGETLWQGWGCSAGTSMPPAVHPQSGKVTLGGGGGFAGLYIGVDGLICCARSGQLIM